MKQIALRYSPKSLQAGINKLQQNLVARSPVVPRLPLEAIGKLRTIAFEDQGGVEGDARRPIGEQGGRQARRHKASR
jgi:hypothetical protein